MNELAQWLSSRVRDATDLFYVGDILDKVKKKELDAITKKEEQKEKTNKIFVDKEFVYETRDDVFIYRDGRTKSGNYYIRIYDNETKKVFSKSLRTRNRTHALVSAEKLYREKKDKLLTGVKMVSITPVEMVKLYLDRRKGEITNIPKTGLVDASYKRI